MSEDISRSVKRDGANAIRSLFVNDFVCGWGAAFVNIVLTYPVNKIMFRQMLDGVRMRPALLQLHSEGAAYLYRGVLPPLFQKTISVSLMFGAYDQFQSALHRRWPVTCVTPASSPLSSVTPTGAGHSCCGRRLISPCAAALAGLCEAVLTPFERVQTLLQDRRHHGRYRNSGHAVLALVGAHGWRELYRGLVPIALRNSLSNVLFFEGRAALSGLHHHNRHHHHQQQQQQCRTTNSSSSSSSSSSRRLAGDFVSGAVIGAATSTLMYPLNVVKTHMQCQVGGPRHQSAAGGGGAGGLCATMRHVYRMRGSSVRRIYRGVHVNYTRSLISWGIINSVYEYLKSVGARDHS